MRLLLQKIDEDGFCFVPVASHESVCWSGGYSSTHINLGTRWRFLASFTPRPFYSMIPTEYEARWALHSLEWREGGSKEKALGFARNRNHDWPVIQPKA